MAVQFPTQRKKTKKKKKPKKGENKKKTCSGRVVRKGGWKGKREMERGGWFSSLRRRMKLGTRKRSACACVHSQNPAVGAPVAAVATSSSS